LQFLTPLDIHQIPHKTLRLNSRQLTLATPQEWKRVKKLNEKNTQDTEEEWEESGYAPMEAMALFRCANPAGPDKSTYMKIFIQSVYPRFCLAGVFMETDTRGH
jgi:hypothetical protein